MEQNGNGRAYIRVLPELANRDVTTLTVKDKQYDGSWIKRGGVGAFMNVARKMDRLENIVAGYNYDVFRALERESRNTNETLLDTIRDLRGYLMLVEAYFITEVLDISSDPHDKD